MPENKYRLILHGSCNEFNLGEFPTKKRAREIRRDLKFIWNKPISIQKINYEA